MHPQLQLKTKIGQGRKIFDIKWQSNPVDPAVYNELKRYIMASRDYSLMSKQKMSKLTSEMRRLNKQYGAGLTIEQVKSLRNIILKDKIIKNYHRMNNLIARISEEYKAGTGILALSFAYDFPPLNLLRGIFIHLGYDRGIIYNIFANKATPAGVMNDRDLKQYWIAESHDAESTFNQQAIAAVAAANEKIVVDFFKNLGIGVKTQDDLAAEQMIKYGRAVLTPDILFVDTVVINGTQVNWLDYKDYICTKTGFLYSSNSLQAQKYNKEWGHGALCYKYGGIADVKIPGAIILDASVLSIKLLNYG